MEVSLDNLYVDTGAYRGLNREFTTLPNFLLVLKVLLIYFFRTLTQVNVYVGLACGIIRFCSRRNECFRRLMQDHLSLQTSSLPTVKVSKRWTVLIHSCGNNGGNFLVRNQKTKLLAQKLKHLIGTGVSFSVHLCYYFHRELQFLNAFEKSLYAKVYIFFPFCILRFLL